MSNPKSKIKKEVEVDLSASDDDDDDYDDIAISDLKKPKVKKPPAKKPASASKKTPASTKSKNKKEVEVDLSASDDDDDYDDIAISEPKMKKSPAKKPASTSKKASASKPKSKNKKDVAVDLSVSEDDEDNDDDMAISHLKEPKMKKAPAKKQASTSKKTSTATASASASVSTQHPTPVESAAIEIDDSFDIILPHQLGSNGECTILVQIDPQDSAALDFTGATGAIGRLETDNEGGKRRGLFKRHGIVKSSFVYLHTRTFHVLSHSRFKGMSVSRTDLSRSNRHDFDGGSEKGRRRTAAQDGWCDGRILSSHQDGRFHGQVGWCRAGRYAGLRLSGPRR
jgi:hypothetical protein